MAEQILEKIRDVVEGQIDFEGQSLADLVANTTLSLVGVVAFLVGYVLQDIKLAVYISLGGTALTFLLVVPAWPFYNKHAAKWLSVGHGSSYEVPKNLVVDAKMAT